jgi:hypothetical protein
MSTEKSVLVRRRYGEVVTMKIESSSVALAASHQSLISHERSETLRAWRGNQRPDFESTARNSNTSNEISISQSARLALAMDMQSIGTRATALPSFDIGDTSSLAAAIEASDEAVKNDPFLSMLKSMIEFLTGRPVRTIATSEGQQASSPTIDAPPQGHHQTASSAPSQPPARAGYGVEYDKHEVYQEIETSSFSAQGVIHTQDGQEISFKLDLQMERSYREETHVSIRAGDAVRKDPLVVNFGGTAAQLLDQQFRFDLNNDGQPEDLPMLASGSGYLAFDRNGNGRIDAGNELFGPATNNGFAELALLDSDGNGWLDENDPLFERLGIWRPGNGDSSANGATAALSSLAENGIGALGLMHLATPFELRGAGNRDLGGVSATGIAITDDGKVLSIQEIDLTT